MRYLITLMTVILLAGCNYLQKEPNTQQTEKQELSMGAASNNPNKYKYPLIQYELVTIGGHCQLNLNGAVTDNDGNIWIIEEEE